MGSSAMERMKAVIEAEFPRESQSAGEEEEEEAEATAAAARSGPGSSVARARGTRIGPLAHWPLLDSRVIDSQARVQIDAQPHHALQQPTLHHAPVADHICSLCLPAIVFPGLIYSSSDP